MSFDLKTLIEKLNPLCRKALEDAAHLCVSQTNFYVEIEHLLSKLVAAQQSDIYEILWQLNIDRGDLNRQLTAAIETFKRGAGRTPAFSPQVARVLKEAWMIASLESGEPMTRSGAILIALVSIPELRESIAETVPLIAGLSPEAVKAKLKEVGPTTAEKVDATARADAARRALQPSAPGAGGATAATAGRPATAPGGESALDKFTIDVTAQARAGKIDPILGRDGEIRQMVDILMRRRQNNPILVGEAGVGKTALVEGLALRIVAGEVPPPLRKVSLRSLDLGQLQAGAGVRGEFEKRLKDVISEVTNAVDPVILFIDETHTIIGAGGQAGGGDAANLLKPALARGELRTIGATTWSEYKRHIEKDPALTRRFQVVKVPEPDEATAIAMLRGITPSLEKHHGVAIRESGIAAAVRLSMRYIEGRQLPDKAVAVLDTACARVALGQSAAPATLESVLQDLRIVGDERRAVTRQIDLGLGDADTETLATKLDAELADLETQRAALAKRHEEEAGIVKSILEEEAKLKPPAEGKEATVPDMANLTDLRAKLTAMQGETPLVPVAVDEAVVSEVIAGWTGIPMGKLRSGEVSTLMQLEEKLAERVIGQRDGIDAISRAIRISAAKLAAPEKPIGVFLLVGPSGVGKTETALALADLLYGGENRIVTINMSEYQEGHSVSKLKGAPAGYVGYGQGGILTEAVRHNPYTVVLLDEFEKAHPEVWELFYQVFDKGSLEDSEGTTVSFRNSLILLTSNLAQDVITDACVEGAAKQPTLEQLNEMMRPHLVQHFKPALVGRMTVIPYRPLSEAETRSIAALKLKKIQRRMSEQHRAELQLTPAVLDDIVARCDDAYSGARTIDRIINQILLPDLSAGILDRIANAEAFKEVVVDVDQDGHFTYRFA